MDELTNAYTLISHTSNKLKNIPSPWKVVLCHSYQSLPETNSFDFDHNRLVLPTLEFRIDRIKQCVLLCLASAQHFWRFIDVIMGIGTTSFNNIQSAIHICSSSSTNSTNHILKIFEKRKSYIAPDIYCVVIPTMVGSVLNMCILCSCHYSLNIV